MMLQMKNCRLVDSEEPVLNHSHTTLERRGGFDSAKASWAPSDSYSGFALRDHSGKNADRATDGRASAMKLHECHRKPIT